MADSTVGESPLSTILDLASRLCTRNRRQRSHIGAEYIEGPYRSHGNQAIELEWRS